MAWLSKLDLDRQIQKYQYEENRKGYYEGLEVGRKEVEWKQARIDSDREQLEKDKKDFEAYKARELFFMLQSLFRK